MKILNRISLFLMLGLSLILSSQAIASSLDLTTVQWAIVSDGSGATGDDITTNSSYQSLTYGAMTFNGYTLTTATIDDSGTISSFTDYTYLTSDELDNVYAVSTFTGTFGDWVGTSSVSMSDITLDTDSTMTWIDSTTDSPILTLTLTSGTTTGILRNGTLLQVTQLTIEYDITDIAAGYFFIEIDGVWVDAYDILENTESEYYGLYDSLYTLVNADTISPSSIVNDDAGDYFKNISGVSDPSDLLTNPGSTSLYIDLEKAAENAKDIDDADIAYVTYSSGEVYLSRVPEPGMLSLMGLAFLGLAGFQRRRNKKQMEL